MRPAFVLKVDVDTHAGLRDGAPRLLDLFASHGVRASWFVSMGPDRTGRAVVRAFRQRGFLRKMVRSRAPKLYPLATMLRGTLLPAVPVVASQPERLREIERAGHEVGVHGWDHVRWHDRLARLGDVDVRDELSRAVALFTQVLGRRPAGFAAPGWQCTGASLRAVDELGFRWRSDTRGRHPYRPCADGYLSSIPEIPTTLPTLDEVIGVAGRTPQELARAYAAWIDRDGVNVHTIHTEVEGGAYLAQLDHLLTYVRDTLPVRTLGEIAAELPGIAQLPVAMVAPGTVAGRGGTVACQVAP
ncbi:MAG: polysaccharide deacetylase family protein [Thermodesulfobacteriota bacterium]